MEPTERKRIKPGAVLAWFILGGAGLGTFAIASPTEKPIVAAGLVFALAIYIIGQIIGNAQEKAKRIEQGRVDNLPMPPQVKPSAGGRRYDPSKSYVPKAERNNGDGPHLRVL